MRCRLASRAADADQGLPYILKSRGMYTSGKKANHATQPTHPSPKTSKAHPGALRRAAMLSAASEAVLLDVPLSQDQVAPEKTTVSSIKSHMFT